MRKPDSVFTAFGSSIFAKKIALSFKYLEYLATSDSKAFCFLIFSLWAYFINSLSKTSAALKDDALDPNLTIFTVRMVSDICILFTTTILKESIAFLRPIESFIWLFKAFNCTLSRIVFPKTVCLPFKCGIALWVIKNWLPLLSGPLFAIDKTPASSWACNNLPYLSFLNSSPNL